MQKFWLDLLHLTAHNVPKTLYQHLMVKMMESEPWKVCVWTPNANLNGRQCTSGNSKLIMTLCIC